jgi:ATP-dependent DNA helicase RecQ
VGGYREPGRAEQRLGVRAEIVNSSNTNDWAYIYCSLAADRVDILLVSPERLANDSFRENMLLPMAERFCLFVVDQTHHFASHPPSRSSDGPMIKG